MENLGNIADRTRSKFDLRDKNISDIKVITNKRKKKSLNIADRTRSKFDLRDKNINDIKGITNERKKKSLNHPS